MNTLFRWLSVLQVSLAIGFCSISPVDAQVPSPTVSLGFGVDTSITDVRSIVRLTRAYLARPDSSARSRGLWSVSSEFDRRVGDIAGEAYQGFPAAVIGVTPAQPGDSVYVVKILYASADSARHIAPLALQRIFAVRERGAPFLFRLSSALPRLTSTWERRASGRLSFWYAPGQRPNPAKIDGAARFVDSVAKLFSVPVPRHLDVYIGASIDEVHRAIGLDFFPEASGPGEGRGGLNLGSGVLLVGDPAIGEAYLHEFVHAVLGPSLPAGNGLLAEGVATWLGGSRGRSPHEMYVLLHDYLETHPSLPFSGLLHIDSENVATKMGTDLRYAIGALVANALYRQQGIAGVRKCYQLKGDTDTLLRECGRQLGLPANSDRSIDGWWRAEAARASVNR
jgi:hypothetical protein